MLLLLRSPPAGPVSALASFGFGLNASGSVSTALVSFSMGLALGSIEINVSADVGFTHKLSGISTGFLSAPATMVPVAVDVTATGGFGAAAQLTSTFGLTGTVGSTLQGIGSPAMTFGLTGSPLIAITGNSALTLGLAGTPVVSGGTVTPAALTSISLNLVGAGLLPAQAICDTQVGLQGTGFPHIVGLATQMRLSFSSDEIRTFFRKG